MSLSNLRNVPLARTLTLSSMSVTCGLAAVLIARPDVVTFGRATPAVKAQACSCESYCNWEDPCPEYPGQCYVTKPMDTCLYPGGCSPGEFLDEAGDGSGSYCCYVNNSPILIDVANNGFNLTSLEAGVPFSITGAAFVHLMSWTSPSHDDAWLVLDRNGNGTIDGGPELFGNHTEQPTPPPGRAKQGFRALAVFDDPANGGNGDRRIDRRDAVFASLRLWHDSNHDGASQPDELRTLASADIRALDLDYRFSKRVDEFGNLFAYRARVYGERPGDVGRWAYDVFLKSSRMPR